MNIKKQLVSLVVFSLLLNPLTVFMPLKTEAAFPPRTPLTFTVLAAGERSSVLAVTGQDVTTKNNGTEWYYTPSLSMGFAPNDATIDQSPADLYDVYRGAGLDPLRLSWHLQSGLMTGGYRAGATLGLNSSTTWSRYIYQSDNVPTYYPSGPQINVPVSSLQGWTLCYSGTYGLTVSLTSIWSSCTGNYLLLGGANSSNLSDLIDVRYEGNTILNAPGGTQLELPRIYAGDELGISLYQSNGITSVPWNAYKVFISNCEYEVCGTLNNPLSAPSEWDSGVVNNNAYTVPTGASNHYLAIIPTDNVTYEGEAGSVVFLHVTTPQIERTISTCGQLQAINDHLMDNYTLLNDLNCADTETWNDGDGFIPIGTVATPFTGNFDGQGYSISNLHINSGANYAGLFGVIEEYSTVSGLHLVNVDIHGHNMVGGLVGMLSGDVVDCSTSGSVVGYGSVGGLVGSHVNSSSDLLILSSQANTMSTLANISKSATSSSFVDKVKETLTKLNLGNHSPGNTIVSSSSTAAVSGWSSVGGLVGTNQGLIELGYATGNVTLQDIEYAPGNVTLQGIEYAPAMMAQNAYGGGFVGDNSGLILGTSATGNITSTGGDNLGGFSGNNDGLIMLSYATGNVLGNNQLGGFTGGNNGAIGIGYARGSVTGVDDIGGFAGRSDGQIVEVYSTGVVTGTGANLGSLIGYYTNDNEDFLGVDFTGMDSINSFWDNQTSGQSVGCGNTDCADIIFGKSSTAMKLQATYTTELGAQAWDFEDTFAGWNINSQTNNGYPFLRVFDLDNDGILDSIENLGPNNGDANNDGTQDSLQENVASFINTQNNEPEVLQVPGICSITSVNTQAESGLLLQDAGFNYPAGLTNFTIDCGCHDGDNCAGDNHGYTADIALYFYGLDPAGLVLRKYNSNNSSYATITPLSLTQVTIGGRQAAKVVYQVTDGGPLDQDGVANGIIVDPVGLGSNVVGIPNTGLGGGL